VGRGTNETKENIDRNRASEEFNSTMQVTVRKNKKKTRKKSASKSVIKKTRKGSKVKNSKNLIRVM
jgi:hypothetical protein